MRRFRFAFKAFLVILRNDPHAFVSGRYRSLKGERHEVEFFRDAITDIWNDEVYQANLVSEAKKILETKN